MNDDLRRELVERATAVRSRAYAPYSHFQVGAAVATADGQVFVGCNVENASYGLTNCAERAAVFAAVAAGFRRLDGMAIVSSGGVTPCGACRQVLAEFCAELPIMLVDVDNNEPPVELLLSHLLPGRFQLRNQGEAI